jgi:hypothetical protein
MNLYFLLEGRRTEVKIYPKWFSLLLPDYSRVNSLSNMKKNNYFIISGMGYPSILNHVENSISDIRKYTNVDYLVISADCDDDTIETRFSVFDKMVNDCRKEIGRNRIVIILQMRCIETWLLGNRKIFVRNPQDLELRNYISFYNVKENDPEKMGKHEGFNSVSQFHADYLRKMLNERNITYTKSNPADTAEGYYLKQLIKRTHETDDLKTLKFFLETVKRFQ